VCVCCFMKDTCMFWSICERTVVHGAVTRVYIVLPKEIALIR